MVETHLPKNILEIKKQEITKGDRIFDIMSSAIDSSIQIMESKGTHGQASATVKNTSNAILSNAKRIKGDIETLKSQTETHKVESEKSAEEVSKKRNDEVLEKMKEALRVFKKLLGTLKKLQGDVGSVERDLGSGEIIFLKEIENDVKDASEIIGSAISGLVSVNMALDEKPFKMIISGIVSAVAKDESKLGELVKKLKDIEKLVKVLLRHDFVFRRIMGKETSEITEVKEAITQAEQLIEKEGENTSIRKNSKTFQQILVGLRAILQSLEALETSIGGQSQKLINEHNALRTDKVIADKMVVHVEKCMKYISDAERDLGKKKAETQDERKDFKKYAEDELRKAKTEIDNEEVTKAAVGMGHAAMDAERNAGAILEDINLLNKNVDQLAKYLEEEIRFIKNRLSQTK